MQRVDASTEYLVSISSSLSSSSSTSVDGMGVEAKACRFEVLEDEGVHPLERVASSGEPVSGVIKYF